MNRKSEPTDEGESNPSENIVEEFEFRKVTSSGDEERGAEPVAVERSYDLIVNGFRIASLMATPSDLKELGYGYLVSEGIVDSKDLINSIKVRDREINAFVEEFDQVDNGLELRSSGCVGVKLEDREEDEMMVESDFELSRDKIFRSLDQLETELYSKTSGSHSASLLDKGGNVLAKSVDVGRHNTFDKVIGKALIEGIDTSKTMLLASGRQSAGTVSKAARANIPMVVTKAAPLSSGIELARKADLTLACFANGEKFVIFAGDERIVGGS